LTLHQMVQWVLDIRCCWSDFDFFLVSLNKKDLQVKICTSCLNWFTDISSSWGFKRWLLGANQHLHNVDQRWWMGRMRRRRRIWLVGVIPTVSLASHCNSLIYHRTPKRRYRLIYLSVCCVKHQKNKGVCLLAHLCFFQVSEPSKTRA
jgi:hypothetical protein